MLFFMKKIDLQDVWNLLIIKQDLGNQFQPWAKQPSYGRTVSNPKSAICRKYKNSSEQNSCDID
jgi:hypothetical protein